MLSFIFMHENDIVRQIRFIIDKIKNQTEFSLFDKQTDARSSAQFQACCIVYGIVIANNVICSAIVIKVHL